MASFVQGPFLPWMVSSMQGLCKRSLQWIYSMQGLWKKSSTMDWMVRWQALCKDHVKISTMDGKLYTRTIYAKDIYNIEAFECTYYLNVYGNVNSSGIPHTQVLYQVTYHLLFPVSTHNI